MYRSSPVAFLLSCLSLCYGLSLTSWHLLVGLTLLGPGVSLLDFEQTVSSPGASFHCAGAETRQEVAQPRVLAVEERSSGGPTGGFKMQGLLVGSMTTAKRNGGIISSMYIVFF